MFLINGFLFAIGFMAGTITFFILLFKLLKATKEKKNATVKDWKEYLAKVTNLEKYDEAKTIALLLVNKRDDEELPTPDDYEVKVDKQLVIDETGETRSAIKLVRHFIITKKQTRR